MNRIKSVFVSISAQIDALVAGIENHEAVAEASLNELKQSIILGESEARVLDAQLVKLPLRLYCPPWCMLAQSPARLTRL